MNYKIILYTIGKMLRLMGLIVVVPMLVAVIYGEEVLPYILTIAVFEALGLILALKPPKDTNMYTKEATVSIGLAWIVISLLGALLFVFSGAIPSYTNAVFEMVSGITTTGSTILGEIESLPKGILFYRNFIVFLGGIGILVFVLAVSNSNSASGLYLLKAESAGPNVKKMTNKLRDSAIITCVIYVVLTLVQFIALLLCHLDVYNALTISLATAGTGGFSPTNQSIASYGNVSVEIVMTVFMFIFSLNFYVYFLIATGKVLNALKNEELWTFLGISFVAIILVTVNIIPVYGNFWNALRYSSFEVASSISCAGFSSADYNYWPTFSKVIILFLYFAGGCAGSTAGGMKIIRVVTLFKASKQRFLQTLNPRKVMNVKIDGKIQDEAYLNSIFFYFVMYFVVIFVGVFLISLDPALNVEESIFAVFTTFNNAGPGVGVIGPMENFGLLTNFSKWILSFLMLVGRLEIFPILILLVPSTWKVRKKAKKVSPVGTVKVLQKPIEEEPSKDEEKDNSKDDLKKEKNNDKSEDKKEENDKKEKELENATAKILKRKERKDLKKARREAKNKNVLASKSSEIAN